MSSGSRSAKGRPLNKRLLTKAGWNEGFLAPAHRSGAEEQILVDTVLREKRRGAHGIARIERGVQPLDRLSRTENLVGGQVVGVEDRARRGRERSLRETKAGAGQAVGP